MKRTGNTILITGGGSGIGEALAHRFHDLGNIVIIAGRRQDVLDKAAAGRENLHAFTLDTDSADGVRAFSDQLKRQFPDLNVLINNAGIMRFEALDKPRDLADVEQTITTNLLGPIRMIDAFIDHLTAQPDAVIVNVTSGLAFLPLTMAATYSATKAALHSYTNSLRDVLKGRVEVIELVPPAVQTGLTPGQEERPGYLPLTDFADEVVGLFGGQPTPPEILVERVRPMRFAEAEGQFDERFSNLNKFAREAQN